MPSTNRRTFLAATAAGIGSLAGCNSLAESEEPTVEYTLRLTGLDGDLADRALWRPADREDPYSSVRREAWLAAVTGEQYRTYGFPAIPDDEYTEHEGVYFQLHDVVTGSERIERSVLRLSWVGEAEDDSTPAATPREQLPPHDQNAVMPAYFAARAREYDGGAPWDAVEQGGYVYRFLDRAESELAPTPEHEYVQIHDTVLSVEVSQETLIEPEHTATATRVASSPAAFEQVADAALVAARLSRSSLDEATRQIFDTARTSEEYAETLPLSDAYERLLAELGFRESLHCSVESCRSERAGRHYVAVDGDHYETSLYIDTTA